MKSQQKGEKKEKEKEKSKPKPKPKPVIYAMPQHAI